MPKLTNQKKLNEWSGLYLGNFNTRLGDFLMREICRQDGTDVDIATFKYFYCPGRLHVWS